MSKRPLIVLALAALAAGCGGGGAAGAPTGPENPGTGTGTGPTVSTLALTPASGSVEVNGTFQLSALPKDAAGNVLIGPTLPQPTFASSDEARATVDATGLVKGLAAGPVTITASLTAAGQTHTATANLTVTVPTPAGPTLGSLVLDPPAGQVAVGATLRLTATALDGSGVPLAGAPAASFTSSDQTKATVDAQGNVRGVAAGGATVTASVIVGGVTRAATAAITVTAAGGGGTTAPASATVQGVDDGFAPSTVTIAAGGTVTWTMVDEDHDITWTGTAPPGGNIGRMDEGESVSRTFPAAGTYTYRCARHFDDDEPDEETGVVIVQAGGGGGNTGGQTPVLTTFSLTPAAPGIAVGGTVQLTATPRDQFGAAMTGLTVTFSSSDATRATVSAGGLVTGVAAGPATITATVTAGGVTRTATVTVTVGTTSGPGGGGTTTPTGATVTTTSADRFSPATVTIQAGAAVTWQFSGDRHNVTFTGAAPTGGNIPDTSSGSVSRTFPAAGAYDYVCTRHSGMTGRVVVQ